MTKIDDESLSAFLDGELPEGEMRALREALAEDSALGERLAALTSVDALVRKQSRFLDDRPLPEAVLRLLREEEQGPAAEVVPLDLWRRGRRFAGEHLALAASLVLMIGFAAGYLADAPSRGDGLPDLAAYTDALDAALSGEAVDVAGGTTLLSRFSFRGPQSRYCRQFQLQTEEALSENVACRGAEGWDLVASVQLPAVETPAYRPASGPDLLDGILDTLMQDEALSLEEEERLIAEQWVYNEGRNL